MKRVRFDSNGKLISVDDGKLDFFEPESGEREKKEKLRTSDSLDFLKEGEKKVEIFERKFWSLYDGTEKLEPLRFSNGKTQEDIVSEIYNLVKAGEKIIFLHGACGTGKSAIALNLARVFGKTSIVVPVKNLQSQYEKDYTSGKYLTKKDGSKMKIAMITGRENHDSVFFPGKSCADPFLPDTIKITDKNYEKIMDYYKDNPLIKNKDRSDLKNMRRISIAPANPHWSPIISADYEAQISDSKKHSYLGCDGKKYVFYHRKEGCSYYDQYLGYMKADVIIFNSAKYNAELSIGRKPLTEVDIIDEADVFLDNFFEQSEINLSHLSSSLRNLNVDSESARKSIEKIRNLIDLEERNKRALGVNEDEIVKISETKIKEILHIINTDIELQSEIAIDETNYSNKALETARDFSDSHDIYVNYRKIDESLVVKLVTTNLSYKIKDLLSKTKALVFMSGTLHSQEVIKHIFQIDNYKVVEAETLNPGSMEVIMTGKEMDCKYSNFNSKKHTREDYLKSLRESILKAPTPSLIHVQAFSDLPSEEEKISFGLENVLSKDELISLQTKDTLGKEIENFKKGKFKRLFSTKCSRGVDFPGKVCNSLIFTKYPNPNVKDIFWKVIEKTHKDYYWEFYRDKARREFLQRLFRAIRSKEDHVYVLSPDIRVLQEVRKLQEIEKLK